MTEELTLAVPAGMNKHQSQNVPTGVGKRQPGSSSINNINFLEVNSLINEKTTSKTTTAKLTNHLAQQINTVISEHQEQTTHSVQMTHTGDNFEVAASKRTKKPASLLDQIDLTLESTVSHEIASQINFGYKQVFQEQKPLEQLLDNLGDACVKVMDSHIDRLAWKFKPKLELAKEKVARLEQIVKAKEKQREQREQLVKLKQQIANFKLMKKQLGAREATLADKIHDLTELCEDTSEGIEVVSRQLLDLNKGNLKQTYQLEDMQLEHDMLAAQEDAGSVFLTANGSRKSLHVQSAGRLPAQRQSYASLEKSHVGQSQINQAIQDKIDNVLEQPRRKMYQQGRIQNKQRVVSEHPDVDMSKLTLDQRVQIEAQIQEIKALQKESIALKKQGYATSKNVYEAQRKCVETQEFYEDCLKSCSKEIVRIHESLQVSSRESTSSHSYLLELLRKKFLEDQEKRNGGIPRYDEMMAGKDLGAIDRHTKNLIYRTIKQIGANAKEEQKRANLLNFNIEWNEFQRFTPLQVIGLMLLREDVSMKIKKVLFHPYGNYI